MDWMINVGAKISGLWNTAADLLPLLGAAGGLLGVGASILTRAAQSQNAADLLHNIKPTAAELSTVSVCIGVLKVHFNCAAHASAIAILKDHSDAKAGGASSAQLTGAPVGPDAGLAGQSQPGAK